MTSAPPTINDVVKLLRDPASYPEPTTSVVVVETHISWVFLTDSFAYKLKKPVHFEFLDFSTPAARRHACHEELRLNQRLAPDVYLAVLAVTCDEHNRLALDHGGRDVDYVVKMRRLPANLALDRAIRDGRLHADKVEAVAAYLADFYKRLPPATLVPEDYHEHLVQHCR
jgi:aminoglycoside phosphotransferase family enzyme